MKPQLDEIYKNVRNILEFEGLDVSDYKLINYGLQFNIGADKISGLIRIYQNKKGDVKIDYSQLKGETSLTKIQDLIDRVIGTKTPLIAKESKVQEELELELPIIGTDESGKGDYFGSLVTAGVYVDEAAAQELIAYGIRDSKKLSDRQNLELAQKISEVCKNKFVIIEVSPDKYNNLYEIFKTEEKNLNTLLAWSQAKAIEEVLSIIDCQVAISDKFADEKFIISKLQEKGKGIKLIQMHKAERNVAVAAASILARAKYLEKLSRLSAQYNISLPKGASKEVVERGKQLVKVYGKESLKKVAKLHFKTTNEIFKD